MCNSELESVPHLFFLCGYSRKIWEAWLCRWGIAWCFPAEPVSFLLSWSYAIPNNGSNLIWRMGFFPIIWTIWLKRNELVFNDGVCRIHELIDSSFIRTGFWGKAKWPEIDKGVVDFLLNIECIRVLKNRFLEGIRSCGPVRHLGASSLTLTVLYKANQDQRA
ncbi:hypothetical protein PTKIN_Ptkin14bG0022800 [Pterospermum kingtungense]